MTMYLIEYTSAHWANPSEFVVVYADSEDSAIAKAEYHMEDTMRELFATEYQEEEEETGYDVLNDESPVSIVNVEVFDETNEHWEFFNDPTQAQFYPVIS